MFNSMLLSLGLIVSLPLQAQLPSVAQTRLNTLHGWKIRVENLSSYNLVALRVRATCPRAPDRSPSSFSYSIDPVLQLGDKGDILPGEFLGVDIPEPTAGCTEGIVAAIFADGHSEGDPHQVRDMYDKRAGANKAITSILPMLQGIIQSSSTAKDVAANLRAKDESLRKEILDRGGERDGQRFVLSEVAGLLEGQGDMFVPSDRTTRNPGIDETMKARGVTREQAHAIVVQRELQEWSTILQDPKNVAAPSNLP